MNEIDLIRTRKVHLNGLKRIANQYLNENKAIKGTHKHKWESDVIENNLKQLKRIIATANKGLVQQELEKYAAGQERSFAQLKSTLNPQFSNGETIESYMTRMMNGIEQFEIFTYSPGFSIVYDLHWIPDGTLGELHDVAVGKCLPDVYEKYCSHRIAVIKKEMLPYLQKKPQYRKHIKLLEDVMKVYKKSSFIFINIVLITSAESLVRELCSFVYAKQNPGKSQEDVQKYIYESFTSLETLVLKGDWKEDIPVLVSEAAAQSRMINEASLHKAVILTDQHKAAIKIIETEMATIGKLLERTNADGLQHDDEVKAVINKHLATIQDVGQGLLEKGAKINITIRARLQFLLRRYKEDRNSIIHGNYADFDKGWKTYVYLSAITKVFELIKEYDSIYP